MKAIIALATAVLVTPLTVSATGGGGGAGYTKEFAPGYYKIENRNQVVQQSSATVMPQGNESAEINTMLEENPTAAGAEHKGHIDKHHKCTCEEGGKE